MKLTLHSRDALLEDGKKLARLTDSSLGETFRWVLRVLRVPRLHWCRMEAAGSSRKHDGAPGSFTGKLRRTLCLTKWHHGMVFNTLPTTYIQLASESKLYVIPQSVHAFLPFRHSPSRKYVNSIVHSKVQVRSQDIPQPSTFCGSANSRFP